MQTKEKKIIATKLRAGQPAVQPKKQNIFFPQVQFVCCLYTTTSFFSTSLNMSDALLMPCDRKKQQQQKYYDEFSFSLNLEKKCCQNTNKTKKLFIKKTWGLLLTT